MASFVDFGMSPSHSKYEPVPSRYGRRVSKIGECLKCSAIAYYRVGSNGNVSRIEWVKDGMLTTYEEWSTGGRPSFCVDCWAKVKDERNARLSEYEAKHGRIPIADCED